MNEKEIAQHYEKNFNRILSALNYSMDEISIADANGKMIYVNRGCEKISGISQENLVNVDIDTTCESIWFPRCRPLVMESKERLSLIQESPSGKKVITTCTPVFDENGEIDCIVTNCREFSLLEKNESDINEIAIKKLFQDTEILRKKEFAQRNCHFITQNNKLKDILQMIDSLSNVDSNVLITGESGTGKSLLADYIHKISNRNNMPFVCINCATIPEALLESELFGYVGGAFTGANKKGKKGLFEEADRGTLFLDEIGDLPLYLQGKLLKVIQDGTFYPVGSTQEKKVNCRIIAATNADIKKMTEEKSFRLDLYYRLNVVSIKIPPLRYRREDLLLLIYHFLHNMEKKYSTIEHVFSKEAIKLLTNYDWPGNVRELENCIERLVVTVRNTEISADHIREVIDVESLSKNNKPNLIYEYLEMDESMSFDEYMESVEKEIITRYYQVYKSSRGVAKALQISDSKAARLIRKYCTKTVIIS